MILSPEAFQKLQQVSTASLTTQLLKRGFRNTFIAGLTPLRPDLRMVGYAFTLRYIPAREDFDMGVDYDNSRNVQRLAVEAIEAGQVLVIDARSDTRAASFGHIIATRIQQRGAAGFVTDGGLRDTPAFKSLDLPTYIRAPHATTSSSIHHPVDMNLPIGCGGVAVIPGDVVAGDAEGVVIIPAQVAEAVAHDTFEQDLLETFLQQKVANGASIRGVYPPNEATRAEYEIWRKKQS